MEGSMGAPSPSVRNLDAAGPLSFWNWQVPDAHLHKHDFMFYALTCPMATLAWLFAVVLNVYGHHLTLLHHLLRAVLVVTLGVCAWLSYTKRYVILDRLRPFVFIGLWVLGALLGLTLGSQPLFAAFVFSIALQVQSSLQLHRSAYQQCVLYVFAYVLVSSSFVVGSRGKKEPLSFTVWTYGWLSCVLSATFQRYLKHALQAATETAALLKAEQQDAAIRNRTQRRILHDLKAPLATLQVIMSDAEPDLALANTATQMITNQVFALNQRPDKPRKYTAVNVARHFAHIKELYEPLFLSVEQHLELFCSVPSSVSLCVPVELMDGAVANLLTNSHKFTPPGGSITLRVSLVGKRLCIEVADTGKGVSPSERDEIWDEGHQCQISDQGLGLGLLSVKSFAESVQGTVWCNENHLVGKGAVIGFSITPKWLASHSSSPPSSSKVGGDLKGVEPPSVEPPCDEKLGFEEDPLKRDPPQGGAAPLNPPSSKVEGDLKGAQPPEPPLVAPPSVLLVEDDTYFRDQIVSCVREHCHNAIVHRAHNGLDGLKKLRTDSYDILLAGVLLPVMDGLTMLQHAQEEGSKPTIVKLFSHDAGAFNLGASQSVYDKGNFHGFIRDAFEELSKSRGVVRALLVDDDKFQLRFLRSKCKKLLPSVVVDTAGDGTEGLTLLRTKSYGLLCSDQNMPCMTGVEMIQAARAEGRLPPVVKLLTASTDTMDFFKRQGGLNDEDVYDKCDKSRDAIRDAIRGATTTPT